MKKPQRVYRPSTYIITYPPGHIGADGEIDRERFRTLEIFPDGRIKNLNFGHTVYHFVGEGAYYLNLEPDWFAIRIVEVKIADDGSYKLKVLHRIDLTVVDLFDAIETANHQLSMLEQLRSLKLQHQWQTEKLQRKLKAAEKN